MLIAVTLRGLQIVTLEVHGEREISEIGSHRFGREGKENWGGGGGGWFGFGRNEVSRLEGDLGFG